jgi:hypothetical protein
MNLTKLAPSSGGSNREHMDSKIMGEIVEMVEAEVQSRVTPVEFEMAYHTRLAIDRIRFAIRHTEQFGPQMQSWVSSCSTLCRGLKASIGGSRSDPDLDSNRCV